MATTGKKIGEILLNLHLITEEQLMEALRMQKERNVVLGQILIEEGYISEDQMIEVLELQYGVESVRLDTYDINPEVPSLISEKMARRHQLIPIQVEDGKLVVAMTDPLNIFALDDLKLATNLDIKPMIATQKDVAIAIEQYYKKHAADSTMQEFSHNFAQESEESNVDLELMAQVSNAPVVKLVESIIVQAADNKVSDIHIEPDEESVRIRYRIDGDLMEHMVLNKKSLSAIVTRVKIMGHLDIAESRIPQDGRVEMELTDRRIDLRISIMPTVYGEKIVIRLLDRSNKMLTLTEMGMNTRNLNLFHKLIEAPNGIILVTGPTGSGKTTTLYATLMELNNIKKNVITVEDPVEYRLRGINQTQVNEKAGLTFAKCLRSILRQDPDIIMIGEIRDGETAQIAVRAAITGHLVLSTLHTNDTASTIARLVDMGIEPYLIASSVVGVAAQRLVKKICVNCKTAYTPNESEKHLLSTHMEVVHKGVGCNLCNHTGYRGRIAIYELLPITKDVKTIIAKGANSEQIREVAMNEGMFTLKKSCEELIEHGITTVEEMVRITNSID